MKVVGLLGGMSWESSIEYYRLINRGIRARLGGNHSAECVMYSFDFDRIERLQAKGDWETAGTVLATAAVAVVDAGAELLLICTNTMHRLYETVARAVDVPVIHIADPTAAAIAEAGATRPLLLGTRYTMEAEFYAGRLRTLHGLDVIVPGAEDRAVVHDIIYEELVRGVVRDESKQEYLEIIAEGITRGADSVIAGCTEIELLIDASDVDVPLFPTAELHAAAAVREALR